MSNSSPLSLTRRDAWREALKNVLPVYIATHIAFLLLTYLSPLFSIGNFSLATYPLHAVLDFWNRWDSGQFTAIAEHGYDVAWRTAFFPLYPMLEYALSPITHSPLIAGLIIANVSMLILFVVLYRLLADDFGDAVLAQRSVLFLALFPTSFFLIVAYNESLFLCLAVLCFYCMRRGHWWLAGLFGFLASLTRSSGMLLLVPFAYEYWRQHGLRIRFNVLSVLLIPSGVALFALYCWYQFNDALAFSHAQANWHRILSFPTMTFTYAFTILQSHKLLSFDSIHTVIDLSSAIIMLVLTILCFVGPWRFRREHWAYALYVAVFYLFLISFPAEQYPVQSLSRQVIELWPVFLLLARIAAKRPSTQLYYLVISGMLLAFLLLQFLAGYWVV